MRPRRLAKRSNVVDGSIEHDALRIVPNVWVALPITVYVPVDESDEFPVVG
ncbi:MAG: hypothetical protein KatS3mg060_1892 [Dehalococcoidia bacterium]|nr:MAG: hypothetical protein KatS3mg060_1892 [Dehalococcoidia bacterium]